jgi:cyclic pyranopterin monophosphate synthase
MSELTHTNSSGAAHMVDVSAKDETLRDATATGIISMSEAALAAIRANSLKKGDALATARIAGIMAAKQTSQLIPLCHPIALTNVSVDIAVLTSSIKVTATARSKGQTGVEMEALTATSVALLTLYDMAKAIDKAMVISQIQLEVKRGGKSGAWQRDQ